MNVDATMTRAAPDSRFGGLQGLRGTLATAALFLLISAVFTWPAARLDPLDLVTRHFDLYVAVWLVEQAPDSFLRLITHASAWPAGESLTHCDSLLLLMVSWLLQGLLSGGTILALLTWLGPVINALAAEHCARRVLDVARPWSLLAGLAYGFSGIAATAVLEGHVYFLMAPWLPLLLTIAWTSPERGLPWGRGLLLGGCWSLSLLTSAYLGLCATLLLVVAAAARPRRVLRLLPGAALITLPVVAWYLWIFTLVPAQGLQPVSPALTLQQGAATLASLTGWTSQLDTTRHSLGAPLGFTVLWLLLLAPVVLRHRPGWKALALLALTAVMLCLGRELRLVHGGPGLPSPVALLTLLPGIEKLRFPIRFAWLYALCGGLVASAVLQAMARRLNPALLLPVLAVALVDVMVVVGLPLRARVALGEVPSAYLAAPLDAPILDVFGRSAGGEDEELAAWARSYSCYYQAHHHRPIYETCLATEVRSNRQRLETELQRLLLNPNAGHGAAADLLSREGAGAIAVHADFLLPTDRAALLRLLTEALGPPTADTSDGGERIVLFEVSQPPG